ncbi:MAG: hypothetical protein DRH15_09925, partial [Deltaproteobacteria bacterium]
PFFQQDIKNVSITIETQNFLKYGEQIKFMKSDFEEFFTDRLPEKAFENILDTPSPRWNKIIKNLEKLSETISKAKKISDITPPEDFEDMTKTLVQQHSNQLLEDMFIFLHETMNKISAEILTASSDVKYGAELRKLFNETPEECYKWSLTNPNKRDLRYLDPEKLRSAVIETAGSFIIIPLGNFLKKWYEEKNDDQCPYKKHLQTIVEILNEQLLDVSRSVLKKEYDKMYAVMTEKYEKYLNWLRKKDGNMYR